MPHSFTKIWIHAVFGTYERKQSIKPKLEKNLHDRMKEKLEKELECKVRIINGTADHVHILFLMGQAHSIKDIMKNVKGESSHWVNQNNHTTLKFAWQIGYGAFSVSESMVKEVENYIRRQKEHHLKMSFKEEYELFLKKYGLPINR